ncbi:MAG: sulfotransferase [Pseudomonadota bacterium]
MCILDGTGRLLARKVEDRPIFVVGGSRSGTSVLLHALGKHRRIYSFNGEDPFITDIGGMMYNLEYADQRELDYYLSSLQVPQAYIARQLRKLAYESAFGYHYGLRSMLRDSLKGGFNPFTKTHWCVKTFPVRIVADGLLKLYPLARFVMIHRSGIDVVNSRSKFHAFKELDFRKQCEEWSQSVADFAYLAEFEQGIAVRHADLVDDPETVFRRIQTFLGLDYDPAPADFTSTNQIHPLASVENQANVDVRTQMSKRAPVHESWTPQQRQIFAEICGQAMGRLGYSLPF